MKIAFLSYLHGFGGAEKQMILLANAMAERDHDVMMVSISDNNKCYQLDRRVKYIFLPDRKTNFLRVLTRYQDIRKTLKAIRPDVTVNFWYQSAYLTALMEKSITGKIIYSERGDPGDKEYSGILGLIRRFTLPRIDGFVFQSKSAQSFFDKSVQARSTVISNPVFINMEDFPEVYERRKAIVNVGRLHPQKNQKLLINAFAMIADQIPEYTLEIYGNGDLRQQLEMQIWDLKLENRIFLKGTCDKIHSLIYDAALFVLSSDYEGIPNVLLEAMALGIPCVSTDYRPGGARELIEDGVDGLIVPVDDTEKLAEAINKLICHRDISNEFSSRERQKMSVFHPTQIYQTWEKVFMKIQSRF